ncbi:zinc carboxypeptidase-like [Venturia canescens]|uniref:zinc carboxypeptidase-like n=1 Tax=Venturia canescens TaxID=32260 RepID=UPI001C9C1931|nr:zinc carboxypeptidase-like [Venturia canescens]
MRSEHEFAINDNGNTMIKILVVFTFLLVLVSAQKKNYDNYKVFRIVPSTEGQVNFLKQFGDFRDDEYSFWKGPSYINETVDLMVGPEKLLEFNDLMESSNIKYVEYIDNVQSLVDNENPFYGRDGKSTFGWTSYHTLEEIYAYLEKIAATYPDKVELVVGGKTYEGRWIKGVKISFKKNNPGVFIEGGIHAREWITPATVTYIINEFLTSNDTEIRQLAESNDWYIFPSFNPDGYVYTHRWNRLWRKTRKPYNFFCYGTDPNRNWGYKWMQGGASSSPCSETFAGTAPFSDIETKTLSEYIRSISDKFYAYIAFHSYSQLLLFPYGHTTEHLDNYDELYAIGKKTIEALSKRYGTKYVTGNIAETIYIATGSSLDWVKSTFKTPIAYTYELRDTGKYGFILPAEQIIPTAQETMDSLIGLFREAAARGIPRRIYK